MDALCVGPSCATRAEDFFVVLCNMLKNTQGVSDVHCVKSAKVPLMRFSFEGILVHLLYAQLQVTSVPEYLDWSEPVFRACTDDDSWKTFSGVRVNQSILQLVPNLQNFQSLLRCIKFWAKRRGVYGKLFGYLGRTHLAILTAFICLNHRDAGLSVLVTSFFDTFANWAWPTPVVLQDGMMSIKEDTTDKISWMPIRLPCSPFELCQSNITRGTFNRIRTEFFRGHSITKGLSRPDFEWGSLFEPFDYQNRYPRFLKVYLFSYGNKDDLGDWVGWVKSHFRYLVLKLEEFRRYCDPNPTEYVESLTPEVEATEPSVVFYWGLHPSRCTQINVASIEDDFRNHLNGGPPGMIRLAMVQPSEFPSNTHFLDGKRRKQKHAGELPLTK